MEDGGVRSGSGGGCLKLFGAFLAGVLVVGAGLWAAGDYLKQRFLAPDPVTVAQASLQGLREQNRLSTFAARYVAVVTSKQSRLGLTAQKTLIMPGSVRYEVDLSKLEQRNVRWDATNRRLSILLPPVEVVGPDVDLDQIREYGAGGILMAITDTEAKLDAANREAAQRELVRQAQEAMPMRLAREATRRAVERSFSMPLRAVGVDASVVVVFPDEQGGEDWDMSRRPEDVIGNMK